MNSNSALAEPASPPSLVRKLPAPATAKYQRLRRAAQRARAIIDGLQVEIDRVRENRSAAQREAAVFDRNHPELFAYEEGENGSRKRVPAQDPHRAELRAAVDTLTAELVHLQDEQRAVIVPNLGAIDDFLAQNIGTKFSTAIFPLPKVGKNETTAAALERLTEDQRRIADELATVQNAPRTIAEAKAAMRAEIEALVARGRPTVDGLFTGEPLAWPTLQVIGSGHGAHQYTTVSEVPDTLGLFAWMNRDVLIAALDRETEAQGAKDADALSADDQRARVVGLEARLTLLRRQAELLRDRLEADGIFVPNRDYSQPEIVLGIERAK